jgi:hypothetical protein
MIRTMATNGRASHKVSNGHSRMTPKRRAMLLDRFAKRSISLEGMDRDALIELQDDAFGKKLPKV